MDKETRNAANDDGPGFGRRMAAEFVAAVAADLAAGRAPDLDALAARHGRTLRAMIPFLRNYERDYYFANISKRLRRRTKYPGGGTAIATDFIAIANAEIGAGRTPSVRKIAQRLGVSAQRVSVVLRTYAKPFYDSHVCGRVGRKASDGNVPEPPIAKPPRPLTAQQAKGEIIFQRRTAGARWHEAVEGTGIQASNARAIVQAWGAKTGVDVSAAFTRTNREGGIRV